MADGQIGVMLVEYPYFEELVNLVPQNNFVSESDLIVGLQGEKLPPISFNKKDMIKAKIANQEKIYLHKLCLIGHKEMIIKLEDVI